MKYFINYTKFGDWKIETDRINTSSFMRWGNFVYECSDFYEGELDKELIIKDLKKRIKKQTKKSVQKHYTVHIIGEGVYIPKITSLNIRIDKITPM